MDAAMVTAIAALIGAPVAGAAAMYGSRIASRTQREGTVMGAAIPLYDSLAAKLIAERDKAEVDEAKAEARALAAEAKVSALEAEIIRLQMLVTQLGGQP